MKNYLIIVAFLVLVSSGIGSSESNPYRRSLEAVNYEAKTMVLGKKRIGTVELRKEVSLAVEVHVQVKNFLPRAMEPWLMINGEKIGYSIGVVTVDNDTTTLGFIVPEHKQLKDGGELSIQMGDEQKTRAILSQTLRRNAIKPLDEASVKKYNLPKKLPE